MNRVTAGEGRCPPLPPRFLPPSARRVLLLPAGAAAAAALCTFLPLWGSISVETLHAGATTQACKSDGASLPACRIGPEDWIQPPVMKDAGRQSVSWLFFPVFQDCTHFTTQNTKRTQSKAVLEKLPPEQGYSCHTGLCAGVSCSVWLETQ